jgi:hypothetical protein
LLGRHGGKAAIILVIIGREPEIQKRVLEPQNSYPFENEKSKSDVMDKLNLLIKICSESHNLLILAPYNTHNSATIVRKFVFDCTLIYERMSIIS